MAELVRNFDYVFSKTSEETMAERILATVTQIRGQRPALIYTTDQLRQRFVMLKFCEIMP